MNISTSIIEYKAEPYKLEKALANALHEARHSGAYPLPRESIERILGILNALLSSSPYIHFKILYECLYDYHIMRIADRIDNPNYHDMIVNKIALFMYNIKGMNFLDNVLKHIPSYMLDIVVKRHCKYDIEYALDKQYDRYNIFVGLEHLNKYNIILTDQWYLNKDLEHFNLSTKKCICYSHSVDSELYSALKCDCGILSSENQYTKKNRILPGHLECADRVLLSNMHFKDKCEYTYTGPYHINIESMPKTNEQRKELKQQLAERLRVNIDVNSTLIVCLEDEISKANQLIDGLNAISNKCQIIFKPLRSLNSPLLESLDNRVIVFRDEAYAPNLLRFACDYLLCGFKSGTFHSSLMVGVKCIPFYTPLVMCTSTGELCPWSDCLPNGVDPLHNTSSELIYAYWPFYFNILDTDTLIDVFFGSEYSAWFDDNITKLQNLIFGKYDREKADIHTAERILTFAAKGTFGSLCNAIYMKKQQY